VYVYEYRDRLCHELHAAHTVPKVRDVRNEVASTIMYMNPDASTIISLGAPPTIGQGQDGISAVRFNAARTHIDIVLSHPDYGITMGTPSEYTRQNIIRSIKAGIIYVTIHKDSDDNWRRGAPINIVIINGLEYLKTDSSEDAADEIGRIPEF
jgi:hypothetical protein